MDQNHYLSMRSIQKLKEQQIAEEEQRLRLLQQDMLDRVFSQQMASSQVGSQIICNGYDPVDVERRNIIALQEELRRQVERKRAEEVLRAKLEEQALLDELHVQAALQQNAAKQLLSHFAEIDQLGARQDTIHSRGAIQNHNSSFENVLLNGHSARQDLMHSALAQSQNLQIDGLRNCASVESNFFPDIPNNFGTSSAQPLRNNLQGNLPFEMKTNPRDVVQGLHNNLGRMLATKMSDQSSIRNNGLQNTSRNNQTGANIRYFNDGNEVNYKGDVLALNSMKKRKAELVANSYRGNQTKRPTSKKRKSPKIHEDVKVEVKRESNSDQIQQPLIKKNPMKLSKYLSSRVSKEIKQDPDAKNDSKSTDMPGPRSDLIGSKFLQKPVKGKKESNSHGANNEKEDKLDAANVLLGLMKNGS
jgi:hypothetical protein